MRTKRFFITFTVIVLLALLTTSAYAASSEQQSSSNLVGTWRINVTAAEGYWEAFEGLHTYFADGNWTEANSLGEVNHGVWMGNGSTSLLTFEGYSFDEQRKYTGKFQVRASITLASADNITGQWEMDTIDLEGNVTENAASGTFDGTRMEVELPEIP
jgi:hypothetical protein